ncbi:helix-turn-helix transcriptional regulator [uncultured Treponema sp.]|uniref:helix-turn-helix domain-containing protein n=1 Tax=uncultured Treponema sp. TaxID=162155 RepID=UPI0025DF5438|nr:helix-turn-helix transcriptional regulator [uncultured Treponema sp.]
MDEKEELQKEYISQLFGRNVKKYRKLAGLTQEQLSERLGVSQKHLSIIETGTQFASASLIGRISEELQG